MLMNQGQVANQAQIGEFRTRKSSQALQMLISNNRLCFRGGSMQENAAEEGEDEGRETLTRNV